MTIAKEVWTDRSKNLPDDKNAFLDFLGSFSQWMSAMVRVQRPMLLRVKVGRVVFIGSFAFTLK